MSLIQNELDIVNHHSQSVDAHSQVEKSNFPSLIPLLIEVLYYSVQNSTSIFPSKFHLYSQRVPSNFINF
jgi:hypothetical protein